MRILIFNWRDLAHPRAGGAEVYAHEVARRWVAAGHDVTQVSGATPVLADEDERDGVRIIRCGGGRLGVYGAARRWYRRTGRGRFDLVIDAVNTRPFGCSNWAADAPVAALVHQVCREVWYAEFPLPIAAAGRWVLEPWWLRGLRSVPVFTVSESSAASLRGYGLTRVEVVGIGCQPDVRPPVRRERRPTVIFVGRLAANKRPGDALEAFARARRACPGAQMWVVGDGPEAPRLRARYSHESVRFFGRVDAATRDELVARAHVQVVTSVREGWGLVVDEAAAMGTPTIGYDRPGLCDSIPAAGGVLVPPRVDELAEGLTTFLPRWVQAPAAAGWRGGAGDWQVIADRLLVRAVATANPVHLGTAS